MKESWSNTLLNRCTRMDRRWNKKPSPARRQIAKWSRRLMKLQADSLIWRSASTATSCLAVAVCPRPSCSNPTAHCTDLIAGHGVDSTRTNHLPKFEDHFHVQHYSAGWPWPLTVDIETAAQLLPVWWTTFSPILVFLGRGIIIGWKWKSAVRAVYFVYLLDSCLFCYCTGLASRASEATLWVGQTANDCNVSDKRCTALIIIIIIMKLMNDIHVYASFSCLCLSCDMLYVLRCVLCFQGQRRIHS